MQTLTTPDVGSTVSAPQRATLPFPDPPVRPVPPRSEQNPAGWLFIAPALTLITVFFFLPVVAALLLSVTDFDIYALADPGNLRIVGLRNYRDLIGNPVFWTAVKNTFYFALVGGPLTVAASLTAALLVN